MAGVLFRRNIAAEIALFARRAAPTAVNDWFDLLQSNRLLGLAYLNIFDLVNYALVGLMFVALFAALRRVNRSWMAIATTLGLVGITAYLTSNAAFSMLSLSHQYVIAATEAQKAAVSAAGQGVLALSRGAVSPEYRSRGVGRLLLDRVRQLAKQNGISRIELDYWAGNESAGRFFCRAGFVPYRRFMYLENE